MIKIKTICICAGIFTGIFNAIAETPGESRPQPILHPEEKAWATGDKVQPPDTLPVSRAANPVTPVSRKPKLPQPGLPTLDGNDLIFNAGWEMIEAPKLTDTNVAALSGPGVDTKDWYDATVPGTVLTTLVDQGVYPDPYYGLNNLAIPEDLNRQDYWYRTEFTVPKSFAGRELSLQFNGINYYAEIWLNGNYLGHITGAFIRGEFDVTPFIKPDTTNVLAVMIAPPPDPGLPSEQSVKYGAGDNGGKLCVDGPTFVCTEGWDWIPGIRDRSSGIWQDVILHSAGPVSIGDPQVVTELPLPDTSSAGVTVQAELHNTTDAVQQGILKGAFEGVKFEQPVTLQAGETKTISFAPGDFPQLTVQHPRLWWPNGYGEPELYHLQLDFVAGDGNASDEKNVRFGIREMSYEFGLKFPDGSVRRFEYTPVTARKAGQPVIDNRRISMLWGKENAKLREQVTGQKPSTAPFWWGRGQNTTVALWPGEENSPALQPATDTNMGPFMVVKVNGRRIECLGGDWGMDDAMKRVSRARLEPYIRMEHDAHLNMIRNWAGQSTSEAFYDLCDQYGILVWNEFWINTEGNNYRPVDHALFLSNIADALKRFRTHPSIALWCAGNEDVPPDDVNDAIDKMVRELDGTRYYQPNSRLVNMDNSGPWSNKPLTEYFTNLNTGFTTELGASSIPSAEVVRTMMPKEDTWPPDDLWAYHDLNTKGACSISSTFERIESRYGKAKDLDDLCRKAQMLNYETYRALYEGFNSRLWNNCSGVIIWMGHPSWPSLVWQFYTWDYEPNASLFGSMKGAEPVHIQMNEPDCRVIVMNHQADPLVNAVATATLYDLSGYKEQKQKKKFTAAADAGTDVFTLDWPATGAHLVRLELRDAKGRLLSDNLYWHARDEHDLQQLDSMAKASVKGRLHVHAGTTGTVIEGEVKNSGKIPALQVRLTLRDAKTGQRILPAYYDDNYFSLMPGEHRKFKIETRDPVTDVRVDITGWNIEAIGL
ncbi:MAG TPA: glycoside hydrolase family 2 TIM barrel-domain containing protein [Candidatus Sulfotelmatobacter sp.]|nr:glycoside hydrolase family 2 TIM barrel-domain containing protein [Candidatus Sulfotelmatobacter sp.]